MRWLRDERAYTFSLTMSFLTITFGAVLLVILLWLATAVLGYQALRNAATSAAYAGQTQGSVAPQTTGTGFGPMIWTLNSPLAQVEAQALWQQEVDSERLSAAFANLDVRVSVDGQDVVVQASGDFEPVFLEKLIAIDPVLIAQAAIPMQVRAKAQWYVTGVGGL